MAANLVTGGFGFLGSYIVRSLAETGEGVVIIDITDNNRLIDDLEGIYTAIKGDLTDWTLVSNTIKEHKIKTIYHIAAMVAPSTETNLAAALTGNVGGTVNIYEASRLLGVENLVYGSSTGVYGNNIGESKVVGEDTPQFPWHMYGTTKVCCERIGEQYHRTYGLNFRGLRFPPILGAGRRSLGPTGFCDNVIRDALSGRPCRINVAPETPIVSAMSVQDAAKAATDLKKADEDRLTRRLYNIDSMAFTAGELADEVKKQIPGADIEFEPDTEISTALRTWPVPNNDRAKKDWDWNPEHGDIGTHVRCFIEEFRANPKRFG